MHPFSLSLFHYLSETSEKMLLSLFSKARNKLDETGVLIRAESIISVYIRSGRDGGGSSVNEMLRKDEPKRCMLPTAFNKADRFLFVFSDLTSSKLVHL